jgi:hypothetical protein
MTISRQCSYPAATRPSQCSATLVESARTTTKQKGFAMICRHTARRCEKVVRIRDKWVSQTASTIVVVCLCPDVERQ